MLAQNLDLEKIQNIGIPTSAVPVGGRTEPIARLIPLVLPYIFGAAGIILLIMLISSGYQIMMSKGDPKAMQAAQGKIATSVVGIILLFAAFWIVRLIGQFLGIEVFDEIFG